MDNNQIKFGVPENSEEHYYEANFKGPLLPLKQIDENIVELVATHQDENALLGLTGSAQLISFNTSTVPNTVSGEASFFSSDGVDLLSCKFHGEAPIKKEGVEFQMAYVHLIFTGGTGQFQNASGLGSVEAELYPHKGFSKGTIKANVITPNKS